MMKYIIHKTLWTRISTLDDITNIQKGNFILDQSHKMSQRRYCLEMLIALKTQIYENLNCLKCDCETWNENLLVNESHHHKIACEMKLRCYVVKWECVASVMKCSV